MFFLLVERGFGRFFQKKIFSAKSENKNKANDNFSLYLHVFMRKNMKVYRFLVLLFFLSLFGCGQQVNNKELLQRSFYETVWERFDYVTNDIDITKATTYNLSLRISFTDDYPYNDISLIFTVFDEHENPYRAKGYKFKLKDEEGQWNVEKVDGCYTFTLPINKQLMITDPGKYQFRLEQKMPITPVVGVKDLVLINN